jgi:hypothetical protein
LFVCLFNSYIVSFFRESMRKIIYSDFSHHLYTIKARKWWSFEFSKWWSFKTSNRRRRFFWLTAHWNRLTFVLIVSFFDVDVLSRSNYRMRWVFCQMFSKRLSLFIEWSRNDQVLSNRTFWNFFSDWDFYFVLISCTRKRHSAMIEDIIENVIMIDENDQRIWWFWFSLSKRKNFRSCRFHNSSFTISVVCFHLFLSFVFVEF